MILRAVTVIITTKGKLFDLRLNRELLINNIVVWKSLIALERMFQKIDLSNN